MRHSSTIYNLQSYNILCYFKVPVLLYKLYGARTILNTIIQSLTPHNSMLNMSLVKHSVTKVERFVLTIIKRRLLLLLPVLYLSLNWDWSPFLAGLGLGFRLELLGVD